MKTRYLYILSIIFFSSIFLLSSCKKDKNDEDPPQPETTVIAPEVVNIGESAFNMITALDSTGTITFTGSNQLVSGLQPGDIIVAPPLSIAPYGFLKEVTNVVTQGDKTLVYTTDATLEDVFISLDLEYERVLTTDDLQGTPMLLKGVIFNPQSYQGSGFYIDIAETLYEDGPVKINANGSIEINPLFIFNVKIRNKKLQEVVFKAGIEEVAELELEIVGQMSVDPECVLASFPFSPITIWVGWVPIVIKPVLEITVGADVTVSAGVVTAVTQSASLEAGLQYQNGVWSPIANFEKSFEYIPPELTAGLDVKGYTGPQLNLLLYGIAGPYADLNGFLELTADVFNTPWWEFYAGAEVGVGIQVHFLGEDIVDYYYPGVIGYRTLLAQAESGAEGLIEGIVKDALNNSPLGSVNIEIFKDGSSVAGGSTDYDGIYSISTQAGNDYRVIFSKVGFLPVTYENINVAAFTPTILEPVLQIDESNSGIGNLGGHIVNALNGIGVDNLSLSLRVGMNNTSGQIIQSGSTSNGGEYNFNEVEGGNYTVEATGPGYSPTHFSVICIGGQFTGNQDATITPEMNEDEIRIILTWGATPPDLDSHLTGPIPESSDRFHVFYGDEAFYFNNELYSNLDYDDVTSFGPETVTIYNQTDGLYRYSIHDYTNRHSNYSIKLSNSSAQVRVYFGSTLANTFYVPNNTEGTLWTVFELFGNNIIPINNMTYEEYPSNVTKDGSGETDAHLMINLPEKY